LWLQAHCTGDPANDGDRSPGGTLNYAARRFISAKDILPAPLFRPLVQQRLVGGYARSFASGRIDRRRNETLERRDDRREIPVRRARAWQADERPIEFGSSFPARRLFTRSALMAPATPRWIRRFHPIAQGVAHSYQMSFRFGHNESFRDVTRKHLAMGVERLKPAVVTIDVEQMRRVLTDHPGCPSCHHPRRTGFSFCSRHIDTSRPQWNWTMAAMGFVSKNIECADQLLREGDRDAVPSVERKCVTPAWQLSRHVQALPDSAASGEPATILRQENCGLANGGMG